MKMRNLVVLVLFFASMLPYSVFGSCLIHLPSLVTELGSEYKSQGKEALQEMFGENIIRMDVDDKDNVTFISIDGTKYFDFTSGILNQTGHMDASFCGEFNLSESAGQGYVAPDSMNPDDVKDVESIPGVPELSPESKETLNKLINK